MVYVKNDPFHFNTIGVKFVVLDRIMSTIELRGITALFGIFLETNKHQNPLRLRLDVVRVVQVKFYISKQLNEARGEMCVGSCQL